jgi:hypothetical protein
MRRQGWALQEFILRLFGALFYYPIEISLPLRHGRSHAGIILGGF